MIQRWSRHYRAPGHLARCFACASLWFLAACATSQDPPKDDSLTQGTELKKPSTEEVLFRAIVQETRARAWDVDVSSPKHRLVSTQFSTISARLRKRRIMRIVLLPRGGALNVRVEYQRNVGAEERAEWVPVEDAETRKRARAEELELARAIEQRFHKIR